MLRLCPHLFYKGKYIPVGRRVFRKTLIKGRKQKSPIILLPPYISVHELRLMLNINYDVCFKAANVYKCGNKYTWRDSENRVFQTVNKRNVIIPYSVAAYVSKVFHFKPKLIEVELMCLETNRSESMSLSEIYNKVYTYEKEFYKKEKLQLEEIKNKKEFAVVSVIGHINHGKTTLLDKITNNNLALYEAGCITQNIKAIHFEVDKEHYWNQTKAKDGVNAKKEKNIRKQNGEEQQKEQYRFTFLDTPGHEVFQIFRGRASFLSDILIILISLEVGAEIQTEEAIKYADKFNLPVIFALNKFDIYSENEFVVKAELKNQCRKMLDEGELKRNYSTEIDNAICISSLIGYNLDKLINRLFFFSQIINLPYHSVNNFYISDFSNSGLSKKQFIYKIDQEKQFFHQESKNYSFEKLKDGENKWKEYSNVLQKYIRKSDCLLALDCHPFGTGIVIDISKDSTRGTLLNVVIRNGYFMEGNYFICGSAYGKIQKMYKHNTNFKETCTYAFVGMAIQISGIKKYGNATTDDLIFTLPQNNAFRLCQYRLMVEKLCSLQISGTEIQVSWENDMKKNEFQAENIYQNRMQMTQKRKAIEEFGGPNTNPNETMFKQISVNDFYKSNTQLRKEDNIVVIELEEENDIITQNKIKKKEKIRNIISSNNNEESILVEEDGNNTFVFFDSFEKEQSSLTKNLYNGKIKEKTNVARLRKDSENYSVNPNIEEIITIENNCKKKNIIDHSNNENKNGTTSPMRKVEVDLRVDTHISHNGNTEIEEMKKSKEYENEMKKSANVTTENLLTYIKGRKNKTYYYNKVNNKTIADEIDETTAKKKEELQEPWYYEKNEKQWTEKILKRNEELTEKWRTKTKQRELEKERQQLYEKKMILQNEITKRNLLGEEKLTEEEIHQYLYENVPKENAMESLTNEEFQFPKKNCPVIPIIIRTNYVGMFDMFLEEFEKLQKEYNVKIAVVHGGVGPVTPNDIVHAEVESEFGYCCIYAFQVKILSDSVKQAVLSKVVIKQFDVFTDLLDDVVNRIKNIKTLIKHNMYVRNLKIEKS